MTVLVNDRDTLLRNASTRTLVPAGADVLLVPSAPGFHLSADGSTHIPASITFNASLVNGLVGTLAFSCVGGTLSAISGNSATLAYADMSGTEATVTAKVTVNGVEYSRSCTVTKVQDGAPGAPGAPGANNALVYAYQRAATAPTGTPGDITYDLSTNTITTTLANGWHKTIPSADGNPLYVTVVTASSTTSTATCASASWSGAVILAQDGSGGVGSNGLSNATVLLWQRNSTGVTPNPPAADVTYTFASGAVSGLTNGWAATDPGSAAGPYLFSTLATASNTTATDTITASEWATVKLFVKDGLDGTFSPKQAWEFRNTLDGWGLANVTAVLNADSVTISATTSDPYIGSPTIAINGAIYDRVRARVRRTAGTAWQGQIYYITSGAGGHGYSESYTKTIPDPTIGGQWVTLEWDMANLGSTGGTDWKTSTITTLRLDLGNSSTDAFEIDWIIIGKLGPVSISDLGFTGDLNATYGANAGNLNVTIGGDNLAYNSSFENMTSGLADGYTLYNNDTTGEPTSASSTTGRIGGLAQVVSWSNSHLTAKGLYGPFCKKGWLPNKTYILSFYAKTSSLGSGGNMRLNWNTPPNTVTALNNPYLSADWQRYSFLLVWGASVDSSLGGGAGAAFISVSYGSGPGNVIIDDVMVVEGDVLPAYYPSAAEAATLATWSSVTGSGKPADNATVGAPAGTNVGSTPAGTVESNAAAGATASSNLANKPVISINSSSISTTKPNASNTAQAIGTATASVSGGNGTVVVTWTITQDETNPTGKTCKITMSNSTQLSASLTATLPDNTGVTYTVTATAVDSKGLTSSASFTKNLQVGTAV